MTIIAIDIETTGAFLIKNKVCSIAFYIGDDQQNELEKHKFNLKVEWPNLESNDYHDFEKKCWDEFWSKQDTTLVTDNVLEQESGWLQIYQMLQNVCSKYDNIVFVTDNPSFDISFINYSFEKYLDKPPLRNINNTYHSVYAADDMFYMCDSEYVKKSLDEINKIVIHDHNCINDAKFIYLQYVKATQYKKKIKF